MGIAFNTKLQKEAIARIRATPKAEELLADRPSSQWPDLDQMAAIPKGIL